MRSATQEKALEDESRNETAEWNGGGRLRNKGRGGESEMSAKRFSVVLVGGKSEKAVTIGISVKGLQITTADKTINQGFPLKSIVRYTDASRKEDGGAGNVDIVIETPKHGAKNMRFRTRTQSGAATLLIALEETMRAAGVKARSMNNFNRQAQANGNVKQQQPQQQPQQQVQRPAASAAAAPAQMNGNNVGGAISELTAPRPGASPAETEWTQMPSAASTATSAMSPGAQVGAASFKNSATKVQKAGIFASVFSSKKSRKQLEQEAAEAAQVAKLQAAEAAKARFTLQLRLLSETNQSTMDVDVVLHTVNGIVLKKTSGEILSTFPPSSIRRVAIFSKLTPPRLKLSLLTLRSSKSEQDLIMVGRRGELDVLTFASEKITEMYLSGSSMVSDYLDTSVESAGQLYMLSPEKYEQQQETQNRLQLDQMDLLKEAEKRSAAVDQRAAAAEQRIAEKDAALAAAAAAVAESERKLAVAAAESEAQLAVAAANAEQMQERLAFAEARVAELSRASISHEVRVNELEATVLRLQQDVDIKKETIQELRAKLAATSTSSVSAEPAGVAKKKKKKKKKEASADKDRMDIMRHHLLLMQQQQQQQQQLISTQPMTHTPAFLPTHASHMGFMATPSSVPLTNGNGSLSSDLTPDIGAWRQMSSATTGRTYYYNGLTGESSWRRPF